MPDVASARVFTNTAPQAFTFGADGDIVPFTGDTESLVGEEFNSYMLRAPTAPFPYDSSRPAHRELRDVCAGRRVRVVSRDG